MPEINLRETTATTLHEAAVTESGETMLRIIAPGWSLNGRYYPAEVLRRDGPQIFEAGTHVYVNHPSHTEEADRPERDVRDLAGSLTENARWDDNGPLGAGLYARTTVREDYRPLVNDLANDIGVSIRADGIGEPGEREGRSGTVITSIVSAESVDFVTRPAAGGAVVALIESVREARRLVPLREARNAGQWLESHIHLDFTRMADSLAADGHLSREERIALSGAIGDALEAFNARVAADAPELYQRDPFDQPDPTEQTVTETRRDQTMPITDEEARSLREARETAERERDEARAEAQRHRDAQRVAEEQSAITTAVEAVEVPGQFESVTESIRQRAAGRIRVARDADGAIVSDALTEAARREVASEVEQLTTLAEAAGVGVRGAGNGDNGGGGQPADDGEFDTIMAEAFGRPTKRS